MLDSHAAEIDKLERPEARAGPEAGARRACWGRGRRSMRSMRLQVLPGGRAAAPSRHQRISPADRGPADPPPSLQVLKLLGSVEGLRLVELGAGIGRCASGGRGCSAGGGGSAASRSLARWAVPWLVCPPSAVAHAVTRSERLCPEPRARPKGCRSHTAGLRPQVHWAAGLCRQERGCAGLYGEPD